MSAHLAHALDQRLARLERLLETLSQESRILMATATDLQTAVDTLKTAVAALVAQQTAPPPPALITQPELDSLTTEVQAITASIPAAPAGG